MSLAAETTSIIVRTVESTAEMRAIEDLQIEAWGDDERDIVPLNQLVAARYVGGSVIGAFVNEKLAGFAYGFYGHLRGTIVHHSHMLAVLPTYRNHNLGFRLKTAQRERVLADRLTTRITWTFDPLQSLNAHFNFAKLGILADTYKINVYGEQGASFLHQNGTDRLFVTWLIDSPRVEELITKKLTSPPDACVTAPIPLRLIRCSESGRPKLEANIGEISTSDLISIEIPSDINAIELADFDTARKWRAETRRVFSEALAGGFVVTDYSLTNHRSGTYLLKKARIEDFA